MKRNILLITTLFGFALGANTLSAASGTWKNVDGTWSDANAWEGGQIADGAGSTVYYPKMSSTTVRTLMVDDSHTIAGFYAADASSGMNNGTLNINSSNAAILTISGNGHTGAGPLIRAMYANLKFNIELTGNEDITFNFKPSSLLFPASIRFGVSNTYSGKTKLISSWGGSGDSYNSYLIMGAVNAIPHGAGKGIVEFLDNSGTYRNCVIDLQTFDTTVNALEGIVGFVKSTASEGTVTLTVGDGDASGNFGGVIEDGGYGTLLALTKIGTGTQTLGGPCTYSGATIVNGGALIVNGSIGSYLNPVWVNNTGTLGGTGTINSLVNVTAGGKIAPGTSAGILTLAANPIALDMSAPNTTYVWELAANSTATPGTDFDQIVATPGSVDVTDANLNIQFTGTATAPDGVGFWASDHSWLIISANSVTGNFKNIQNGTNAAGSFYTTVDGSGVTLNFKASGVAPPTPKPIITSVTGAGTASVTVNYSNTVAGKTYTLQYATNLTPTINWYNAASKAAAGFTDSQTDATAIPGEKQRYYRIYTP